MYISWIYSINVLVIVFIAWVNAVIMGDNNGKDTGGHMGNKEYTLVPKQNLIGLIYVRNIVRQSEYAR